MRVSVYSREAIESVIADGKFPENTAVISFYDPAIKRIDEDYSHVDYSSVCNTVFYSELDDLDLDVLRRKGYTYDTYFPEAPDIAAFIYHAYNRGMDIICQCEYGQSRSAATAAAILEHFYHNGISIFSNYDYYPNQVVYHKTFDALEQYRRYHDNRYYYAADTDVIKKHIAQLQFPETLIADYKPEDSHSVVDFKEEIEKHLSKKNMLHHTQEEIINALKANKQPVYASFKASKLFYLYFGWNPDGIGTCFRYGCEEIPVYIYFNRYYFNTSDYKLPLHLRKSKNITFSLGSRGNFKSLSFFGKLSWDSERKMIDAIPLIITNMQA